MISVILPAFQEAENLEHILPELSTVLRKISAPYEILVIDTTTPLDNTKAVCDKIDCCRCISREDGNMYGDAIRTGFAKSIGDYVVVMDADGSHDPKDIVRFYQAILSEPSVDLIIGSRYCKGGHTDNSFILRLMSRVLNITYKIMFGLKIKDVSDSFRMYKGKQVRALKLSCNNFDIVEEILILLNYSVPNFTALEVPISFNKRDAGESKRNLVKFIASYLHTMYKLMKIKKRITNTARSDVA